MSNKPDSNKPDPAVVTQAIELYVREAYGAEIPASVRMQLSTLKSWKGDFFRSPIIAPDYNNPPRRYTVRLGNRYYPHMKLAVELGPDEKTFLFKADTHDRHCCPGPSDPEYNPFLKLMENNQKVADAVETAWASAGIPTFKSYLRDDLARRQAEAQAQAAKA